MRKPFWQEERTGLHLLLSLWFSTGPSAPKHTCAERKCWGCLLNRVYVKFTAHRNLIKCVLWQCLVHKFLHSKRKKHTLLWSIHPVTKIASKWLRCLLNYSASRITKKFGTWNVGPDVYPWRPPSQEVSRALELLSLSGWRLQNPEYARIVCSSKFSKRCEEDRSVKWKRKFSCKL